MNKYRCNKTIAILMAVFNGEKYLNEQINSILSQSCKDWELYIRDDCSTDSTVEIINEYTDKYHNIFLVDHDNRVNLGAKNNFFRLLELVDAQYYMLSDADDVWFDYKLAISINKVKALENQHGYQKPILVFSNVAVTDEQLNITIFDYWKTIKLNPKNHNNLYDFALIGYTSGATLCFNRTLRDLSFPYNPKAIMHDWWIGLTSFMNNGIVSGIDTPLLLYRKHGGNVTGEVGHTYIGAMDRIRCFFVENKKCRGILKDNGCKSFIKYWYHKIRVKYYRLIY